MIISTILYIWVAVWTVSVVMFIIRELYRNFILDPKIRKENIDEPVRNEKLKESKKNINDLIGLDKKTFLSLSANMIVIALAFLSFIGTNEQSRKSLEISDGILSVMRSTENLDLEPGIVLQSDLTENRPFLRLINQGPIDAEQVITTLIFYEYDVDSDSFVFGALNLNIGKTDKLSPLQEKIFPIDPTYLKNISNSFGPSVADSFDKIMEVRISYRRSSDKKFYTLRSFNFSSNRGPWIQEKYVSKDNVARYGHIMDRLNANPLEINKYNLGNDLLHKVNL